MVSGEAITSAGIMAAWSRDCMVVAVSGDSCQYRRCRMRVVPGVDHGTESAARFALGGSTI